jgi:osomolarity two-component system phosphorelay intermediate protein YPD1
MYFQTKPESTPSTSAPAASGSAAPAPAAADDEGIPTIDAKDVPREPNMIIDIEVLEQIREMDEMDEDDEDDEAEGPRAFSRGIVYGYFEQAENTFVEMQRAL